MYSRNNLGRKWVIATIIGLLLTTHFDLASGIDVGGDDPRCPPSSYPAHGRTDYRLRDSTAALRWAYDDNYHSHLKPALSRMDEGDFQVMGIHDLHWTFERWPNHYLAFQLLQRFEAGGGHADYYVSVSCYFERAKWFAPDDANILVLQGVYEHKKGLDDLAERSWLRALQIDHDATEAHYNLGLMYFNKQNFSKSVEHARLAYDLGYPLPGLKSKLIKKGYWQESPRPRQ